jgi:hypothetical protein
MKKSLLLTLLPALVLFAAAPRAQATPVDFTDYGFTIEPPATQMPDTPTQILTLALPAVNNSSANVTVTIETANHSIKEISDGQKLRFTRDWHYTVVAETLTDNAWTVEYTGNAGDIPLHWYMRMVLQSKTLYTVRATSKDEIWPQVSDALKKSVDSFVTK